MINTDTLTQRNFVTGTIVVVLIAVCAVSLLVFVNDSSSDTASGAATKSQPYEIGEKDAETGIAGVTLTERRAERTGIETASVTEAGQSAKVLPALSPSLTRSTLVRRQGCCLRLHRDGASQLHPRPYHSRLRRR